MGDVRWDIWLPQDKITKAALGAGFDPFLIMAIVQVESAGRTQATRFEKGWKYLLTPEKFATMTDVSQDTEINGQSTSWGLMQVMGTVARELNFTGLFPELCIPNEGLKYGCLKLKQLYKKHGDIWKAVSAYNAGAPKDPHPYVDKVKEFNKQLLSQRPTA